MGMESFNNVGHGDKVEKNELPESSKITDISLYIRYLVGRAQKDVSEAVDEKDEERKSAVEERFSGIASRISRERSNVARKLENCDDLIAALQEAEDRITQLLSTAYDTKNENEIRIREKELKQIQETRQFAEKFDPSVLKYKPFLEWQQGVSSPVVAQNQESKRIEQVENQQEIKEAKLILGIMADGSVGAHLSIPHKGVDGQLRSGFQEIIDSRWDSKKAKGSLFAKESREFFDLSDRKMTNIYNQKQIREFVGLIPAIADAYEDVDVETKEKRFGGLLGSKTTVERQRKKVGTKNLLHKDVVIGGNNEPLFKLLYSASNRGEYGDDALAYKDDRGRSGNTLDVTILLPQSTALEVMEEIRSNPVFVRKIVSELMMRKIGISKKAWEEGDELTIYPVKPPYENWDKAGENMYIKETGDEYGFNPERVVPIK